MKTYGYNKHILVVPFEKTEASATVHKGFAVLDQKTKMMSLKVIAGNQEGTISTGDIVWLSGELIKMPWANVVYTNKLDGFEQKYIIIPEDVVRFIEKA